VAAKGRPAIASIRDLSDPAFARIAVANPETAPYGRAARESLKAAGLLDPLRSRVVSAETVRDALRYVETGDADAGFAAESEARGSGLAKYTIPRDLYAPIRQELAVVARSPRARDAAAFAEFLKSPRAREIWIRYGYGSP
jgi:molybdate transport system substrate-binding protein